MSFLNKLFNIIKNFIYNNKDKFYLFFKLSIFLFIIMIFIIEYRSVSCDKEFHLLRLIELAKGIKVNGIFNYPYYINFHAFNEFGYATETFYGDLLLIPFAFLINMGINSNIVYTLSITLSFILIFISMYYAYKRYFNDNNKGNAFLISYLYTFSNFILFESLERNALGANFAYIFIPWVVFSIINIVDNKKTKYEFILLGLSMGLLALSHVQTCLIVIIGMIVYCLYSIKKIIRSPQIILELIKASIVFILFSGFYIFPMVEQMLFQKLYISSDFTYKLSDTVLFVLNLFVPNYFWRHFIPLEVLLAPNIRLDRILRFNIFPSCFIPMIFMIIVNIINRKNVDNKDGKSLVKFSNIITIFCFLASFTPLIVYISLFNFLQFPWRVVTLMVIFMPIGFVLANRNRFEIICMACILTFINAFCYLILLGVFNTNKFIEPNIGNGEYLPIEVPSFRYAYDDYDNIYFDKTVIKGGYHLVLNNDLGESKLELPVIYYKGYEVYSDSIKLDISKSSNGLIEIDNNNQKDIYVKYKKTKIQVITKYISIVFSLFLIFGFMGNKLKNKKRSV